MGVVHATAVYDYEKQDRSAHRSIYDNEYFPVLLYLTLTAIRDSRQIHILFFERRLIVGSSADSSGHCEVKCSFPFSWSDGLRFASSSKLARRQRGRKEQLPPAFLERSVRGCLLTRPSSLFSDLFLHQPNINPLCIFHDSLLLLYYSVALLTAYLLCHHLLDSIPKVSLSMDLRLCNG